MTSHPTLQGGWAHLFEEERFMPMPVATMLSCPGCGGLVSSHDAAVQRKDLDRKLKCGFCGKLTPVKRWQCPCNLPWHQCSEHANCFKPRGLDAEEGRLLTGHLSSKQTDVINFDLKRTRKFKTPEDIIAADQKRARTLKTARQGEKRKADIVLTDEPRLYKKPTCLGPILRERFGRACASAPPS